jgi:acyl-CoA synthetase (AMP-forming)/AMP-acid ligase II
VTGSRNLAAAIVDQAATRPDLRVGTVDDQLALSEAVTLAAGRARSLLSEGVRPGDRLALVGPSSTDYVVTWLACLLAGAPVALVNPTYPQDLLTDMLAPLAPSLVLDCDAISQARTLGGTDVSGLPGLDRDAFDPVSFMHTSGTTGMPKFCLQTHEYFRRLARAMSTALDLTADDRVLAPLPLFHINPMGYGIITALLTGADALTVNRFSASGFWPAVREQDVTVLILHAPPVQILKRATTAEHAAGHRVRTMFFADRDFLEQFGVPDAVSGYGSTEAGGVSHLRRWRGTEDMPDDASRHGGPGRDDIQWRLDGDGLVSVRESEPGALFGGYVSDGGVDTARDVDGWYRTGDIGRAEGTDYLVFLERGAESIRVKGEFVPIPFVENAVAGVAELRDLALWKRQGELVDDDVVLYVVADYVPVEEIRKAVAGLPAFMRPVAVARVEELPRDAAAGKVQRRLLAQTPVIEWVSLA